MPVVNMLTRGVSPFGTKAMCPTHSIATASCLVPSPEKARPKIKVAVLDR
jgi:hypothetical protein